MAGLMDFTRSKNYWKDLQERGGGRGTENELTIHRSHRNLVGIDFWRSAEIRVDRLIELREPETEEESFLG